MSLLKAAVFQHLEETVFLQQLANQQPELFLCLIPATARVKIYVYLSLLPHWELQALKQNAMLPAGSLDPMLEPERENVQLPRTKSFN